MFEADKQEFSFYSIREKQGPLTQPQLSQAQTVQAVIEDMLSSGDITLGQLDKAGIQQSEITAFSEVLAHSDKFVLLDPESIKQLLKTSIIDRAALRELLVGTLDPDLLAVLEQILNENPDTA